MNRFVNNVVSIVQEKTATIKTGTQATTEATGIIMAAMDMIKNGQLTVVTMPAALLTIKLCPPPSLLYQCEYNSNEEEMTNKGY